MEEELVLREFNRLYAPQEQESEWFEATKSLVMSYLTLVLERPGLLSTILRMGSRSAGPAAVFRSRFKRAVAGLDISEQHMDFALELLVDAVHGFAFADQLSESSTPSPERFGEVLDFYLETLRGLQANP